MTEHAERVDIGEVAEGVKALDHEPTLDHLAEHGVGLWDDISDEELEDWHDFMHTALIAPIAMKRRPGAPLPRRVE